VDWVRALGSAGNQAEASRRYVSFVEAGIGAPEPALEHFKSAPVGAIAETALDVEDRLRDAARCTEFPRAQRFITRPPLAQLFERVTSRSDRDARAIIAVRNHGYTMREVAEVIGRHYITVSRALARAEERPASKMSECKT